MGLGAGEFWVGEARAVREPEGGASLGRTTVPGGIVQSAMNYDLGLRDAGTYYITNAFQNDRNILETEYRYSCN